MGLLVGFGIFARTKKILLLNLLRFFNLTKNKTAFLRIILLTKKCVFKCIMTVYNEKDDVNTCKQKTQAFTPKL